MFSKSTRIPLKKIILKEHAESARKPGLKISILVFFIIFLAIAVQLYDIDARYGLAYETGFQELIAKRHHQLDIEKTYGISTLNNLGLKPTFHPTHPPLLQWILAGMYFVFGESERTARLIPLISLIVILLGLWRLTRNYLSLQGRLATLMTGALCPLSTYAGRVVNFESPVLACIVLTLVLLEELHQYESPFYLGVLFFIAIAGSLIDWPYQLFLTSLLLVNFFLRSHDPIQFRTLRTAWILSMGVSLLYVAYVFYAGAERVIWNHISFQSGAFNPEQGFVLPPILSGPWWWYKFIGNCFYYGSPVFTLGVFLWILFFIFGGFTRHRLHYINWALLLFFALYLGIFSRASYNHVWCYFYALPLFAISFGLLADRLKWYILLILLLAAALFSIPVSYAYRTKTPLLGSTQFGRVVDHADNYLPQQKRTLMNGPLLYVNRVDPLPYYADCETSFFSLSLGIPPHSFLIRHRPEFVALTGYASKHSVTYRPSYPPELDQRLEKSYTLVHNQFKTQLWESLWSPFVSVMGMLHGPEGSRIDTVFVDDLDDVHVGAIVSPGQNALQIDLSPVLKAGRRWLHGWVIAQGANTSEPIEVQVETEEGSPLGSFHAIPQMIRPKWQEFWLPLGTLPERISLSWNRLPLLFGDLRLVSETLWTDDLTRILAGEIERQLDDNTYNVIQPMAGQNRTIYPVLHQPAMGIDRIDLPPIRIGYEKELVVEYGMHPRVLGKSDGADFRVEIHDMERGSFETLIDDTISLQSESDNPEWRTRRIDLSEHSRHMLRFSFEVGVGKNGDSTMDHALWKKAVIRSKD